MKVLGLSGSPRKDGATGFLIEKVLSGAEAAGAETKFIQLNKMNIKACQACMYCRGNEGCAIKDDMQKLYDEIRNSDKIVLGSPIYMHKETAQTKTFIDRLFPFLNTPEYTSKINKKGLLVVTQGNPDKEMYRSSIDITVNALKILGIDLQDKLIEGTMNDAESIRQNEEISNRAYNLGREMTTF